MANVLIPLANGFEDIEAITIIDVLRRGGVDVTTASIHPSTVVVSAHGVSVKADALFVDVLENDYDAIVLPGGGEGVENLKNSDKLIARLGRQQSEGGLLCAICAAPLVLVEAGVLEPGVQVTCYPTCQMDLDREWVNQPVVAHENVITSQAPGTALLFALVVLQTLTNDSTMGRVARGLVTNVLE